MAQIEVLLRLRDGREQCIQRPLHFVGGKPAITYKGRKWPIDSKGHLDLRRVKPFAQTASVRPASLKEAQKFKFVDPKAPRADPTDVPFGAAAAPLPLTTS